MDKLFLVSLIFVCSISWADASENKLLGKVPFKGQLQSVELNYQSGVFSVADVDFKKVHEGESEDGNTTIYLGSASENRLGIKFEQPISVHVFVRKNGNTNKFRCPDEFNARFVMLLRDGTVVNDNCFSLRNGQEIKPDL